MYIYYIVIHINVEREKTDSSRLVLKLVIQRYYYHNSKGR